jgi:hypothetical protein
MSSHTTVLDGRDRTGRSLDFVELVHNSYVFVALTGALVAFLMLSGGDPVHVSWIAAFVAGWSSSWSP